MCSDIFRCTCRLSGSELAPEDTQQLVQQGGSILMKGRDVVLYEHADSGILKTTDVEKVLEVVKTGAATLNA